MIRMIRTTRSLPGLLVALAISLVAVSVASAQNEPAAAPAGEQAVPAAEPVAPATPSAEPPSPPPAAAVEAAPGTETQPAPGADTAPEQAVQERTEAAGATVAEPPVGEPRPNAHGDPAPAHATGDAHGGGHHDAHHGHEDPSPLFNFWNFSYRGKDRYGGAFGDGKEGPEGKPEQPMSPPFALLAFNFIIVVWILIKFGRPAGRQMAETRSDAIKSALDEAADLRAKAQAKLTEYETRLKDADREITTMIEGMRADAAAEKQRIVAAAEKQAQTLKRDAELRIAAEIERARTELTREVTAAAIKAAEVLLARQATPADQQKLVSQFVGDMQKVASQRATTTQIRKERS